MKIVPPASAFFLVLRPAGAGVLAGAPFLAYFWHFWCFLEYPINVHLSRMV